VHAWQATNAAVLHLALSTLPAPQRRALAAAVPAIDALARAIAGSPTHRRPSRILDDPMSSQGIRPGQSRVSSQLSDGAGAAWLASTVMWRTSLPTVMAASATG